MDRRDIYRYINKKKTNIDYNLNIGNEKVKATTTTKRRKYVKRLATGKKANNLFAV